MTWLGGGSIEQLGDRYVASVGFAVTAWDSLIYYDSVEDCRTLKVLLSISSMVSHCLEGSI